MQHKIVAKLQGQPISDLSVLSGHNALKVMVMVMVMVMVTMVMVIVMAVVEEWVVGAGDYGGWWWW